MCSLRHIALLPKPKPILRQYLKLAAVSPARWSTTPLAHHRDFRKRIEETNVISLYFRLVDHSYGSLPLQGSEGRFGLTDR
jgi:hypothetical protein